MIYLIIDPTEYEYTGSQIRPNYYAYSDAGLNPNYYQITGVTTPQTNLGLYTINLNITSNNYYAGPNGASASWSIVKRRVTLTLNTYSFIYDGTLKQVSHTLNPPIGTLLSGQTYTHTIGGQTSGTNIGTYTVTLSIASSSYFQVTTPNVTWSIVERPLSLTLGYYDFTYNRSSQTVPYTVNGVLFGHTNFYTVSGKTETNARTYTLTLTLLSTSSFSSYYVVPTPVNWVIKPKQISLTLVSYNFTYNGTTIELTPTVNGVLPGDTNVYTVSGTTTARDRGNYTLRLTSNSTNYTVPIPDINWSIASSSISLNITDATYNGIEQSASTYYIINGVYPNSDSNYSVSGSTTATNAGDYILTLSTTSNNYQVPTPNFIWKILKKPISLKFSTQTQNSFLSGTTNIGTYDGNQKTVSYIVDGSLSTDNGYSVSGSTTATNAGTYPLTLSTTSTNYEVTVGSSSVSWTILKKPILLRFSTQTQNSFLSGTTNIGTYDGTQKTVSYIVDGSLSTDNGYSVSGTTATNAGTYPLTLSTTSTNYEVTVGSSSVSWTILKKPILLRFSTQTQNSFLSGTTNIIYDGTQKTVSYIVDGSLSTDNGYSVSGSTTATNAGTYQLTLSTTSTNYEVTVGSSSVSWSILRAPTTAPTNLTATRGDTQVTLQWVLPTNNTGSPITSFTVYYNDNDSTVPTDSRSNSLSVNTGTATSGRVNQLLNNKIYYFRVAATNTVGHGPTSNVATSQTLKPTTAPTNVSVIVLQSSRSKIQWDAPTNNLGNPVTSYQIYYSTDSTFASYMTKSTTNLNFTIDSLSNYTTYYYKVAGFNSIDIGPFSTSVSATQYTIAPSHPPSSVVVTHATLPQQVTLSWTIPTNTGDPYTKFDIQYSKNSSFSSGNNNKTIIDTISTSTTFSLGLGIGYVGTWYFRMSSGNNGGSSYDSNVVNITKS